MRHYSTIIEIVFESLLLDLTMYIFMVIISFFLCEFGCFIFCFKVSYCTIYLTYIIKRIISVLISVLPLEKLSWKSNHFSQRFVSYAYLYICWYFNCFGDFFSKLGGDLSEILYNYKILFEFECFVLCIII